MLDEGANKASGSFAATPLRQMSDGASTPHFLKYDLYTNSGRSVIWGGTVATGNLITGTGQSQNVTVYGRIQGSQTDAPAGAYNDTVVATVNF